MTDKKSQKISAPNRLVNRAERNLTIWLVPIALLAIWQALSQFGVIPARIMPSPLAVVTAAVRLVQSNELFTDISVSTARALAGLAVGGTIGFTLGLVNGLFPLGEKLLDTTIQMTRTIPNLALLPLVILWFGIG